jgi:hypothetical protein
VRFRAVEHLTHSSSNIRSRAEGCPIGTLPGTVAPDETYQDIAQFRGWKWATVSRRSLSQAEERQDRENNNNQTDDVDDLVHG